MRKMKIIVVCVAILSLGFASLLNTTDQVNNDNPGLGGNPAVKAYTKGTGFEGGFTLMEKFAQSASVLADQAGGLLPGYKSSDVDPKDQMGDIYLSYTMGLDSVQMLNFEYDKSSIVAASRKYKNPANTKQTLEVNNSAGIERIGVAYSRDMNKFMKGLYLGAGIYQDRAFVTDYVKASKDLGAAKTEQDLVNEATYTSLAFGAIYDLDNRSKLTVAQNFSAAANWDKTGKEFIAGADVDEQYNEEILPETTVGYIYKLNDAIELAGTVQMFWTKDFTRDRSIGGTTEIEMTKFGYTGYTLAGEYKLAKDLCFQSYYGWANKVGVETSDSVLVDDNGYNVTAMGINVVKNTGVHTLIAGLDRGMVFDDNAEPKTLTDETKFYLNYGYSF